MTNGWIGQLTDWLALNPSWLALAIFLIALLESLAVAGLLVPGVAFLFAVAALAGKTGMPLELTLFWAWAGAVLGDGLSFWLGRRFQGRLDRLWPFTRYPRMLRRGESFFYRHGGLSIAIGRFVGPVRPVVPLVAGALAMSWPRFLAFNLSSAVVWAPVYILPGFLVGGAMARDVQLPPHFYPALAISVAIIVLIYLVFFRLQMGLDNAGKPYQALQHWVLRYNTTHRFWRSLSSERPSEGGEFPLASLGLFLGASALAVCWLLMSQLLDLSRSLDEQAHGFFQSLRHPLLDPLALLATLLSEPPVLAVAGLVAAAVLALRGYYAAALHILLAMLLVALSQPLLEPLIQRPSPETVSLPPVDDGFAGFHAVGVCVALGLAGAFAARESSSRRRWRRYALFGVPLLLMAFSQVALGLQWLSDVIGGLLVGLAICGLIRATYSRYDQIPLAWDATSSLGALVVLGFAIMHLADRWQQAFIAYMPLP